MCQTFIPRYFLNDEIFQICSIVTMQQMKIFGKRERQQKARHMYHVVKDCLWADFLLHQCQRTLVLL